VDRFVRPEKVELAKICIEQARATTAPDVATELRRMAKEYQKRAAQMNGGQLPDTGKD
jgi:hypothetical protein